MGKHMLQVCRGAAVCCDDLARRAERSYWGGVAGGSASEFSVEMVQVWRHADRCAALYSASVRYAVAGDGWRAWRAAMLALCAERKLYGDLLALNARAEFLYPGGPWHSQSSYAMASSVNRRESVRLALGAGTPKRHCGAGLNWWYEIGTGQARQTGVPVGLSFAVRCALGVKHG